MVRPIPLLEVPMLWKKAYEKSAIRAPFFMYDWHALWFNVLGKDWEPYALLVDDAVMAPLARKGNEVIFSGGAEISDYQDLIGPDEAKTPAWPQILAFLKTQGVISLRLRNVPQSSPTVSFFRELPAATTAKEDTTPLLALPSSWKEHVEGLPYKERHELRRKLRKFEREHPSIAIVESPSPQADIRILLDLMAKDDDKRVFLTPEMKTFSNSFRSYSLGKFPC